MKYDIVFAGAGLAALSIAARMADQPYFAGKKILLIDRDRKEANDRTWCFWATPDEIRAMPPVITRSWPYLHFYSRDFSRRLNSGDYQYHMVSGRGFYQWAKNKLAASPNVEWLHTDILEIDAAGRRVITAAGVIEGRWILNSAITPFALIPSLKQGLFRTPFTDIKSSIPKEYIYLLQHFTGWVIRTDKPVFDPEEVTMMDFRVDQSGHTRFVYVLPFSEQEALVEFTVFSPALLSNDEYEQALKDYIHRFLDIEKYEVVETEFGVIPMTDYPFPQPENNAVINIGTAGGFVKGSSGYAFKRTQRRAAALVDDWAENGAPDTRLLKSARRFRIYDTIFLRALADGFVPADRVFSDFFKNLGGKTVFQFLDEDSGYLTDFRALNAPPLLPFIRAAFRQMLKLPYV